MARPDLILDDPAAVGIDAEVLAALYAQVEKTVARHDGCAAQVAVARAGRVAGFRAFGSAPFAGQVRPASRESLFAVFSVTKAFVSSAAWMLLAEGRLALEDRVVEHIPEFGRNGKEAVTVEQLLTHTAGFPSAAMATRDWLSEKSRLARFADWELEWEPGSRFVYHGNATMWIVAQLVTQLAGTDYRDFIRTQIFEPLGLTDLFIGLPPEHHDRVAEVVLVGAPMPRGEQAVASVDAPTITEDMVAWVNGAEARSIGSPGGGAIGTAADVALFYQGVLASLDPAAAGPWDRASVVDACTPRNVELIDPMTKQAALRGLGLVVAGEEGRIWRGFAPGNSSRAVGHMGAGGQVAWADPESGISFSFVTNGAERNAARQGANGFRLSNIVASALAPLMLLLTLFLGGCDAGGDSPHRVYVMLGFHGNFYHSWRGDTPDEAGFGQDIRIVREILRMLDEANAQGLDARGYWDIENLFTYETILPEHAPDILESLRRRIGSGRDEALLMPYDNGLLHAMTEDELRANVRWAISNPWGSGVRDLFGRYTPIFRPQEMTLTAGTLPILAQEGVEGLVLLWAGVPFNALSSFVPAIPPEQRYGTTRVRLRDGGPSTILLPAGSVGDIVDHVSLEKWLLDVRALQTSGAVDRDLLIHINADADGDFWLPQQVPTGFGWLPNVRGLLEHIEAVNRYEWAAFTTPGEWLAEHPPEGEVLVRQDLADGAFDGQYSWAEKFASHGIWTLLEQSRLAGWRADALAPGSPAPSRARAESLLRGGRDSSFFQRVAGLSTTHFGMSTPIVNEERQAVAEGIVARARELAREAEGLLAEEVALRANDGPDDALYAFEVRDLRVARAAGGRLPARTLLRLPVVFAEDPPALRLETLGGRELPHALVDLEVLGDGRWAGQIWAAPTLAPGERQRLFLRPVAASATAGSSAPDPTRLANERISLELDATSGIASLRTEERELAGEGFLSSFVTYRSGDVPEVRPNEPWRIEAEPVRGGDWLKRVRLSTRIPFTTPEDGEVEARVEAVLSLPGDAPWVVADVSVDYPYTTKRDILHNPAQKLRRYLDRRWVEVAPFQLHPRLDGSREDPLRVWKHNYLGVTSHYDLDYARINPRNAELDAFNHQVTAGWVAVSDHEQGLLVAEDADVRASFAFAPMRLRERDSRQQLWLNPFGSYHGRQLDYTHTDGTGLGAEVTELFSSSLHPNGPSYDGEREQFSLLLAPYAGDAPPEALRADAASFFAAPAVVYVRTPPGVGVDVRLAHELLDQIAEAQSALQREAGAPIPAPRAFLVNPTAGAADVVWDEPRDASIDGYEVAWRRAGADAAWRSAAIGRARRHRVDGLVDGDAYDFRARALSAAMPGPWTATLRAEIGPVGVVEMGDAVSEMSLGLKLRLFRAGLVHWWSTR